MVVLGIVLIALAVLFGLGVSVSSTAATKLEVFGVDFGVAVPTVFFLGVVAGAALILGLWLTKKGLGRSYRRRKEIRELRAQAATSDTPATDITESDTGADVPAGTTTAGELPADERLAAEQHTVVDPADTKQPH
jgi:hypothetical protein